MAHTTMLASTTSTNSVVINSDSWMLITLLCLAALAAGWVDAVAGSGGLIQIPAMMIAFPTLAPVYFLATNKFVAVQGTTMAAITYARRGVPIVAAVVGPMAGLAAIGSVSGACLAALIPTSAFRPIVVILLLTMMIYTATKPSLGQQSYVHHHGGALRWRTMGLALAIGFYDGIFGPGTGSFLTLVFILVAGYNFVTAGASTKIVNIASNMAGLLIFAWHGVVLWQLGIAMGLANIIGGYLGAHTAVTKGNSFVRIMFLIVSSGLILRVGYDTVMAWKS